MSSHEELYYSCKFMDALRECDAILSYNPSDEDALWTKALCLRELAYTTSKPTLYQDAIKCFEQISAIAPQSKVSAEFYIGILTTLVTDPDAWNNPHKLNTGETTVAVYQGPSAVFANDYNENGLMLAEQRNEQELAITWYNMAIKCRPHHAVAWYNKGTSLARLGKHDQAIECFDKAIGVDTNYGDAYFSKAGCAKLIGKVDLALDCYSRAIEINPHDTMAAQRKAELLKSIKNQSTKAYDGKIAPGHKKWWQFWR